MKILSQQSDQSGANESAVTDQFVSNHALLDRWKSYTVPATNSINPQPRSSDYGFGWRQGIKLADEHYSV